MLRSAAWRDYAARFTARLAFLPPALDLASYCPLPLPLAAAHKLKNPGLAFYCPLPLAALTNHTAFDSLPLSRVDRTMS